MACSIRQCIGGKTRRSILWAQILFAATTFVLLNTDVVHGTSDSKCVRPTALVSAEHRLIKCLTDEYDPSVRPVSKASDVVNVTVNLVLIKLVELNEQSHVLDTNVWIHKSWMDANLKWNKEDYDQVDTLRLPIEKIWKPDLVLYNNADYNFGYVIDKLAVVMSTGQVIWVPHARFKTYCNLQLGMFPFDTQTCTMSFGSWTHDISKIDVSLPHAYTAKHIYDGKEWKVLHVTVARQVVSYGPNESYPVITWTVKMKRQGSFYKCMLVAPSVILAFLVMFVFLVPPASSERLPFAVGILLCQILMMLLLADYLPTEMSDFPTIGVQLLLQIVMVVFSMLISIGVLNCHHRGSRKNKVPNWLRRIFLGRMSRMFCLKPEMYTTIPSDLSTLDHGASELRSADELGLDGPHPKPLTVEATLEDIRKYLKVCAIKAAETPQAPGSGFPSHRELVLNEWQEVAMVIDRMMTLLYIAITLLIVIFLFSHS